MITRRTKIQLVIFAIITLVGVSIVGARYARLDRMVLDTSYTVTAHFADSGGIFVGAEVTYRGTTIGRVEKMVLTDEGVDVELAIENEWDEIPADTDALVANRSAVGEQFVDLLPNADDGPYLEDGSEIADPRTDIPIPTAKLLKDVAATTGDIDREALRTVVRELGLAFDGTGRDLGQIIDTADSFIRTANRNFDLTTALIRDSNTVLNTQLDLASSIRSFSQDLDLFSTALAGSDKDLRRVIDNGSSAANELRVFIEKNEDEVATLLNRARTVGEVTVKHLDGIEQLLVIFPWAVEGTFTVVSKDPGTGQYDAHFGLVLTNHKLCHGGYEGTDTRPAQNGETRPMPTDTRCTEPAGKSNARGAQHAPRPAPANYRAPVIAKFDPETKDFTWRGPAATRNTSGAADSQQPATLSASLPAESWKALLRRPLGQ